MKIECSAEKLKEAVGRAEKITGRGVGLESLRSILFIASGKSLKIRATNLSLGLETEVPAKIAGEGEFLVSGEVINNTLMNLGSKDKTISLENSEENLLLNNKNTKVVIKSVSTEDFPTIPVVEGKSFKIDVKKFVEGIRAVFYSAAVSDIKPEISSVYVYSGDGELVFVSTDSFRLAEKKVRVRGTDGLDDLIIPYKNIIEIIKLLSDMEGEMAVFYNKNQVSFVLSGTYLTSRLIDGSYPDYRQIVPKEHKTKAVVLKKDLVEALRLANVFSDKFNQIKIAIDPKGKKFEVYAVNKDVGQNKTNIEGALEGAPIEMSFNHKYILDCFQSIPEDSVVLELSDPNRPAVLYGSGDRSFLYLLMPMNR